MKFTHSFISIFLTTLATASYGARAARRPTENAPRPQAMIFQQHSPLKSSQEVLHPQDMYEQFPQSNREVLSAFGKKHKLVEVIEQSPLLSFHKDIVEIESITENEAVVGDFIIQFLRERNFTVEKQQVETVIDVEDEMLKERFNIFAYPNASLSPPKILLTSHIDTVPPYIPYSLNLPDIGDDHGTVSPVNRSAIHIDGRGTVDAKASVAAQVFAVLEHLETDPLAALGLLFVVGEERNGIGMKTFSGSPLNTDPPTYHTVIFGEPTELKLVTGHKGMTGFRISAHGKAAHSGYPWLGASAISPLLSILHRIEQLGDIPVEDGGLPRSPTLGKTTLNIGKFDGGVAPNVVPAYATADVAVRLAAGTPEMVQKAVRRVVVDYFVEKETEESITVESDGADYFSISDRRNAVTIDIDFKTKGNGYPPVLLDTDMPGFETFSVNYGTDVPNLYIHGNENGRVKRYLYGPGTIFVAHGDDEGLAVWEVEEAVRGYRRMIKHALSLQDG